MGGPCATEVPLSSGSRCSQKALSGAHTAYCPHEPQLLRGRNVCRVSVSCDSRPHIGGPSVLLTCLDWSCVQAASRVLARHDQQGVYPISGPLPSLEDEHSHQAGASPSADCSYV